MTTGMRIWVDADACPRDVKDLVFRASERLGVPVTLVANKTVFTPRSPLVSMVQVKGGPDVADDHIVTHAVAGDVAITSDVPLAARLVANKVVTINPRGELYDEDNVGERLAMRDLMTELRDQGVMTSGPAVYGPKDKQKFANALDRALRAAPRR
jgi:uncharacterized protein YaiI (UPF0178 family)